MAFPDDLRRPTYLTTNMNSPRKAGFCQILLTTLFFRLPVLGLAVHPPIIPGQEQSTTWKVIEEFDLEWGHIGRFAFSWEFFTKKVD